MRSLPRLLLILAPCALACNAAPSGDPGSAWDLGLLPIVPDGQDVFLDNAALTVRVTQDGAFHDDKLPASGDATWQLGPVDDLVGAVIGLFLTDPDATVDPLDYADLRAYGQTPAISLSTGARDVPVIVAAYGVPGGLGTIDPAIASMGAALVTLPDGDRVVFGGTGSVLGMGAGQDLGFDHILRMSATDEDLAFKADGKLPAPSSGSADQGLNAARIGARADVIATSAGPRVLVTGGREKWTPTGRAHSTALLLDPANDWAVTARPILSEARSEHVTVPLADGTLLVFGGWDGSSQATKLTWELYQPGEEAFDAGDEWTQAVGSIGMAWADLGDLGVLLCGGGSTLDSPDTLTPSAGCGIIRPDMLWGTQTNIAMDIAAIPVPNRMYAAMAPLGDGRVLLTGGVTQAITSEGTAPAVSQALVYDMGTRKWERVDPLNHARAMHRMVALPDGRVLIMGGVTEAFGRSPATVGDALDVPELYDPSTGTFTDLDPTTFSLGANPAVAWSAGHGVTLLAGVRGDGGGDEYGVIATGP